MPYSDIDDMPSLSASADTLCYNLESGKVYRARSRDGSAVYTRVGDGQSFTLSEEKFWTKFNPLDEEQATAAQELEPLCIRTGTALTMKYVEAKLTGEAVTSCGSLVKLTDHDVFTNLILRPETVAMIEAGYRQVTMRAQLEAAWHLSRIAPAAGERCALNFYGPPGTGKTASARCLAKKFGKQLFVVDYALVTGGGRVGMTARNIKQLFEDALMADAILYFDEADSLVSKRIQHTDQAFANSVNQNRNVLLQELDKFKGIVIFSTNMFKNYDEAMLRRMARHVEFALPDEAMRRQIIELHLPDTANVDVSSEDLDKVAKASHGLSGGDLLNVVVNGVVDASASDDPSTWVLTGAHLLAVADEIQKVKRSHARIAVPAKKPRKGSTAVVADPVDDLVDL